MKTALGLALATFALLPGSRADVLNDDLRHLRPAWNSVPP
jgi:hypothetical protein